MPVFQPRNRVEIIREMVARAVSRSKLTKLTKNSAVYHVLAAAANEDAEQYVQMARLRSVFNLDSATGSDLDERAAEIQPAVLTRRLATPASGNVIFSRQGIVGTTPIPAGTFVGAADSQGTIQFRTTSAGSIGPGDTASGLVPVVATTNGVRGNVAANTIIKLISRNAGITGVTNPGGFSNGVDRESDEIFRGRIRSFVQAISRATPTALESYARNVVLADGRRVIYAKVVEPITPTGSVSLYIDDGTGNIEEYSTTFLSAYDTLLASATGGETDAYTTERPIRDDGSFSLEVDTGASAPSLGAGFVVLTRGTDYELNAPLGQVEFSALTFPTGLPAATVVRANYRNYINMIKEVQRVIDGDPATPTLRPGVRAAGVQVIVKAPAVVFQSLEASISVSDEYDLTEVSLAAQSAILQYINSLTIGQSVIIASLVEAAMAVDGMYNFKITLINGSTSIVDQVILKNQVARVLSTNITLT